MDTLHKVGILTLASLAGISTFLVFINRSKPAASSEQTEGESPPLEGGKRKKLKRKSKKNYKRK